MLSRRRFISAAGTSFLAMPGVVEAQPPGKVYQIGVLGVSRIPEPTLADALRLGLRERGWIENENIAFVKRESETVEGYPRIAAELVALRPDVIVTGLGEPAVEALKAATTTIPIVMQVSADPVGSGLVASLARPGGNITGMSILAAEVSGKRLEILKEAVPRTTRVAVPWNAAYPAKAAELRNTQLAAAQLKAIVHSVELRGAGDLPVEQATKFELVINLKTAKALGLTRHHYSCVRIR